VFRLFPIFKKLSCLKIAATFGISAFFLAPRQQRFEELKKRPYSHRFLVILISFCREKNSKMPGVIYFA
jgi:hypothetical protein